MAANTGNGEMFLRSIFNRQAQASDYKDYLKYFNEEIHSLLVPKERHYEEDDPRGQDKTHGHAARDVKDLILIAKTIASSPTRCRPCVRTLLRGQAQFKDSEAIPLDNSINLALRLMLTLNARTNIVSRPDTAALQWNDEDTLEAFVTQQFPPTSESMHSNASHRMDDDFTAMALRKYRGVKITWTSSLEDHLRLKYNRKTKTKRLKVFPYKRLLIDHLKLTGTESSRTSILPKSLVTEAIWTLDQLFPPWDPDTRAFLIAEGQHFQNVSFSESPPPGFWRYHHWRARLVELHDEFHAPPRGLWATLRDYRNPVQWWTFWLAVFIAGETLVFGVVASVLTGLLLQDAYDKSDTKEASTLDSNHL